MCKPASPFLLLSLVVISGVLITLFAGCNADDPQHTGIYQIQIPGQEASPIPLWASPAGIDACGDRAKKPEPSEGFCRAQLVGVMVAPGYANLVTQAGNLAQIQGMEGRTIGARGWVYKDWIKEMTEENLKVIREQRSKTTVIDDVDHLFSRIKQRLDF